MVKDTAFWKKNTLNFSGNLMVFDGPKVMGIVNITPDSFFPGSRVNSKSLLDRVNSMLEQGADFIDLGGYSSRPGAENISLEEEISRVLPVVKMIKKEFPEALISVDTFRSEVAKLAVMEGANLINDISGGSLDKKMFETLAGLKVPYILMHMKGTPQNMIQLSHYENILFELIDYFTEKIHILRGLGVKDLIIDPGFGFAKNADQNFNLLGSLEKLKMLGVPMLAGLSRKSMIYKTLNIPVEEALPGTVALNMVALQKGVNILRVHDVKEAVETIKLFRRLTH